MKYPPENSMLFRCCVAILYIALLLPREISGQSCINDFNVIREKESFIVDTTFPRMYVICPRRMYDAGQLDFSGNVIQPPTGVVVPPIPLRSNMTIRCGDQGSRDNLCWINGGDLHIDGTSVLGIADETVENVSIEGFVFNGARQHSVWVSKPGSITFRDCEFRNFTNSSVPIMLDYYDASAPSKELVATFLDCEFRDNRYFGMGAQTALIYVNSVQNRLVVESSLFENNDMIWNNTRPDTHSFIIESLGPTTVEKTCFRDNMVGASDIVVFGSTFTNNLNFVSNSSGMLCPFSSVFETIQQFDSFAPTCVDSSETACIRHFTSSPSRSPTSSPAPTERITVAPSSKPSESKITTAPTAPSIAPSKAPIPNFVWPTIGTDMPESDAIPESDATKSLRINCAAAYSMFLLSTALNFLFL